MEAWPAERTKRSRFVQCGAFGSWRRNSVQMTKPMSAIPIGVPGCPDFAFSTASTARKRMALTQSCSSLSFAPIFGSLLSSATAMAVLASCAAPLGCCSIRRPSSGVGLYSAHSGPIFHSGKVEAMTNETVTVKGSPVRSLQKFIDAELTPDQRAAVLAALPPEYATRLRGPVLATETIPVTVLNKFTEEAAKAKGGPGGGREQFHGGGGEGEGRAGRAVRAPRRPRGRQRRGEGDLPLLRARAHADGAAVEGVADVELALQPGRAEGGEPERARRDDQAGQFPVRGRGMRARDRLDRAHGRADRREERAGAADAVLREGRAALRVVGEVAVKEGAPRRTLAHEISRAPN